MRPTLVSNLRTLRSATGVLVRNVGGMRVSPSVVSGQRVELSLPQNFTFLIFSFLFLHNQHHPSRFSSTVGLVAAGVITFAIGSSQILDGNTSGCDALEMKVATPTEAWARDKNQIPWGMKIFTGNSNRVLSEKISSHLDIKLGESWMFSPLFVNFVILKPWFYHFTNR